ncbi:MAG: STAS domain-containing protein [Candidatus Methanomethylophilaceae archaeon]|nr:STAS domain-containing protein [Candidatus Methanomethylophilaceae archaeon]
MQIEKKIEDGILILTPMGSVDYVTAPELDEIIESEAPSIKGIILDMANVPYIASAGLRTILNADELMEDKEGIKLKNVNKDVMSILQMSGFLDTLNII